jgi:hypothetical protein
VVSAYLLFMEACADAYEATEFFNSRRTTNGKVSSTWEFNILIQGLNVAS